MPTIAENNERIYILKENFRYWETMKERGYTGSVVGLLELLQIEISQLEERNEELYHEAYGR
jgi:hypothetical protein